MHKLNDISIREYLRGKGITPIKETSRIAFYHSPLRKDANASFKVDLEKNLWIDFGTGEGGTMIDLAMKLNKWTLYEAMTSLSQYSSIPDCQYNGTSLQQPYFSFHGENSQSSINIKAIEELSHPALLNYINKRAIEEKLAIEYCKQIRYSVNNRNYFAIGFRNDSGRWNLRSEYFKGCTSMDVSTVRSKGKSTCIIFEGFMDFLSYQTMKEKQDSDSDIIVLNSTVNLPKIKHKLSNYKIIQAFLDNDEGGRRALNYLISNCEKVIDQSVHYQNFKDLNEYHNSRSEKKKKQSISPIKRNNKGFKL